MPRARIIYVMGPSGAGKTGVIEYARRKIDGSRPIVFAHRYITRPIGNDIENYVALSPAEFVLRKGRGLFACDWKAYGTRYGVGREIRLWLDAGLDVVIDGSRAHFARRPDLGPILPVLITAGSEELRRRLVARAREDAAAIDARLDRAARYPPSHPALVTIDNSGAIETAGEAFARLLSAQAEAT